MTRPVRSPHRRALVLPPSHKRPSVLSASAGGSKHRPCSHRGELADARRPALVPVECAAVVKAEATVGDCAVDRRWPRRAAGRSLWPTLTKPAVRARSPKAVDLRAQWASPERPRHLRADFRPVIKARPNSRNGTNSSAPSGWRGGAAIHVDTGMNRLGSVLRRGGGRGRAGPIGDPRHHPPDESTSPAPRPPTIR